MTGKWRWAGARSIGTSHLKNGTVCQDFACAKEFWTTEGRTMAAVISDGAGSALHAEIGSRLVCVSFLRACLQYFRQQSLSALKEEIIWDWVDGIREAINAKAQATGLRPRDFAATLVAVLAAPENTVVVHIGDGAAVIKRAHSDTWEVPSWPYQGEYASTTTFVTDDPQPRLVISFIDSAVDEFAVFSDGIERLVLDQVAQIPHAPFFNRMVSPLKATDIAGPNRNLSLALRSYLDSPNVCERTDDDKSLILGVRS
ncbi:protein phosphatase 2C domain-containing protein [Agrobacterium rhizogenes]|nr:protein phosphatase 2C domain-containing protein [Rhizobium rhizogenes]